MMPEIPVSVSRAILMLWISLAVGPVRAILDYSRLSASLANLSMSPEVFLVLTWAIVLLVYVFLVLKIRRGRNWARIIFLVLFILGLFSGVKEVAIGFRYGLVSPILGALQVLLQGAALVLLFIPDSRDYFRKKEA
jgi:hypothetical protein